MLPFLPLASAVEPGCLVPTHTHQAFTLAHSHILSKPHQRRLCLQPPSPPFSPVRFLQHIYKRYQSQRLSPGSPRWSSTIVWSTAESVHASLAAFLSSLLCVTQSVCLRPFLVLSQPRLHCSRFLCWQWNQQLLMRGQVGSCRRLRNQCQLCQRGVCSVGFKCLSVVFYD